MSGAETRRQASAHGDLDIDLDFERDVDPESLAGLYVSGNDALAHLDLPAAASIPNLMATANPRLPSCEVEAIAAQAGARWVCRTRKRRHGHLPLTVGASPERRRPPERARPGVAENASAPGGFGHRLGCRWPLTVTLGVPLPARRGAHVDRVPVVPRSA